MFAPELLALNLFALIFGNGLLATIAAIAALRRGWRRLAPFALFMPFYWQLSSIAAFRALVQLATRPFYWEKTRHVLSRVARERRIDALNCAASQS